MPTEKVDVGKIGDPKPTIKTGFGKSNSQPTKKDPLDKLRGNKPHDKKYVKPTIKKTPLPTPEPLTPDKSKDNLRNLTCSYCTVEKRETEYYVDTSSNIGRMAICKECFKSLSYDERGQFSIDKFVALMKRIDKPFIYKRLENALATGKEPVGMYVKSMNIITQDNGTFVDSDFNGMSIENMEMPNLPDRKFQVTDELIKFWGKGYDAIDYENYQVKYEELSPSYSEKTAFHTEKLKEYIRFQCKAERAMSENNLSAAKVWFEEARKSADAAKINPKQMSQADLSGGLDTFGEFFREVEKASEIMDILPEFKFRPKDAVDFAIWCYVNYARDIKGLPQASYEEIYQFYDKSKEKFIAENGNSIFEEDPTLKNRPILEKWVTYNDNSFASDPVEEEVM